MASNTKNYIQTSPFTDEIKAMNNGIFMNVRQLDDGTVIGLDKLPHTTAIYIDMDLSGWRHQYCFDDPMHAVAEFAKLECNTDTPSGWSTQRP